jgi:hypothetical protein
VSFSNADAIQRAGVYASTGDQVVFGSTTIENTGSEPAELQAGRLVGDVDPADAAIVQVRALDLGPAPGSGDLLGASSWPAPGYRDWWRQATPIDQTRLPAGNAAEIIFLVEVRRTGDWRWEHGAVDYQVGDSKYQAVTNFGFQVCPPKPEACSS